MAKRAEVEKAARIARKAERVVRMVQEGNALLEWEAGLLRKALATAAELLKDATPKKRGDGVKLAFVRRIARIHAPASGDARKETP